MRIFLAALLMVGSPAAAGTLERADGSSIHYDLDRGTAPARQGILLMLQGSGCEPAAGSARIATGAPQLAPGHAVLTIEKYGVAPGPAPPEAVEGCAPAYWRGNTLNQRVLDALQVVARLRGERWWNGELLLFGGSEGGAVAALLAPLIPELRAVIIRSSGIGVPVAELIAGAVPPPVAAELPRILAEAKARPSGDKRWGGASYRWWAEAADVTPAKALRQARVPVLLIHGSRDQFAPVATARATRDLMAGAPRFTYREYAGYDHFMVDAAGVDRSAAVLADAAAWLRAQR